MYSMIRQLVSRLFGFDQEEKLSQERILLLQQQVTLLRGCDHIHERRREIERYMLYLRRYDTNHN